MLAASVVNTVFAAAELDEGVIVLTDANFDEEMAKYDFLLVEFYAPWCGHCKKLAPEYAAAAGELAKRDPPLSLAKVDVTENKELGERFGIKGFPTLKFFKSGTPSDYEGGRTKDAIINYVVKKSGPPSNTVDCDGLKKLTADNKFVVAYFGVETDAMYTEAHVPYASAEDKIVFAHTSDAACATGYGASAPGVVFFRKFETEVNVYTGKADKDSLISFVKPLMVPTVFEFSEEEIEAVFGQQQPTVLLFRSDATDKDAAFMATFEEAAKANKGKMLFGYSDIAEGIQERLAEFIGINESQLPSLRAIIPNGMKKYEAETKPADLTVDIISKFVDDVLAGKITPSLKSEPIPEKNDEPVKVIVGKEFEKIVKDETKDVFVKYYAPWCGHCKKLAEPWKELATNMAQYPDLVIGKFDATANEAEGVEVRGYPTLIFYPKDNKAGISYDGERDVESFTAWLKENAPTVAGQAEAVKDDL